MLWYWILPALNDAAEPRTGSGRKLRRIYDDPADGLFSRWRVEPHQTVVSFFAPVVGRFAVFIIVGYPFP